MVSLTIFLAVALLLPAAAALGDAGADLAALQEEFFVWNEEQAPEFATDVGFTKAYNDRLANMSIAVFDSQYVMVQRFVNRTRAIDQTQLTRKQQYSYDVLLDSLTTFTDNYGWRLFSALNPISFLEGFYLDLVYIIEVTPFENKVDFENYVKRLEARPTQIQQMIDRMREAIRQSTTYHIVSMVKVPGQIDEVISTPPAESKLFEPFTTTLPSLDFSLAEKDDLKARALVGLQGVWTSLQGLKTFIVEEYMPHTRGTYGVGGWPAGANYYRACLKWHLSLDLSPAQVHNTGLREVDRITQLMHQVMARQGFNGTVAEYYAMLNADPRFHMDSAEEVMDDFRNLIFNRTYPKLTQIFKDIPSNPLVVKPLPYDGPAGMYNTGSDDGSRPGTFYVNVHRPTQTNTFSMVAVALHETVPGHHLQAIYVAAAGLPNFQKHFSYNYFEPPYHLPFYTAHIEGWGLYAEYLGEELGIYQNDYELMGRYGLEIFRACRLVVDTGMHFMGWSRQRAIDYLSDRTPMPRAEVEIEIDRYLTWPGQACAYKIGELKLKELRRRATTALGSNFDVRDFHSLILNNGPVPLSVLETIVNDYITEKGGNSHAPVVG